MTEIYTLNTLGIFNNINHNKEQLELYNNNIWEYKHVGNVLLFNFTLRNKISIIK